MEIVGYKTQTDGKGNFKNKMFIKLSLQGSAHNKYVD